MTHERMLSAKDDLERKLNRIEKQYWKLDEKLRLLEQYTPHNTAEVLRLTKRQDLCKREQDAILETLRLLGWDYRTEDLDDPELGLIFRYIVYSPYD